MHTTASTEVSGEQRMKESSGEQGDLLLVSIRNGKVKAAHGTLAARTQSMHGAC